MLLPSVRERVGEPTGTGVLRRLQRHERHPQHERARVPVLELARDHVPGAFRNPTQPPVAVWKLGEAFLQRRPPADRRVAVSAERALRAVVVVHHSPKRLCVAARELRELLTRAVEVPPLRQRRPVRERDVRDGIRVEVLQPVVGQQPQLVVPQGRAGLDEVVRGRAGVVQEAGERQLLGGRVAAHDCARVEYAALEARTREIGSCDERVVTAARDDDVERFAHWAAAQ